LIIKQRGEYFVLIYMLDLTHKSDLGLSSETIPLQLGLIAAYCKKECENKVEIQIFKSVEEFSESFEQRQPQVIASSNYLWNLNLGYRFAQLAKEENPAIITVFGGPNYPDIADEQVAWLEQYSDIDIYIYKDGEVPFTKLIQHLLLGLDKTDVQRMKLPSCHSSVNGEPFLGPLEPRLQDLTVIPSPYTEGLLNKFFEQKLIPTIQTNRGCPFACTFCTEGSSYYNKIYRTSLERKVAEVDYIVARTKYTKTLRITDSNFGMYREDVDFCRYLSSVQQRTGYPEYVACTTGKNQKERIMTCNELLNGAIRLTASVQSMDKGVLVAIKRSNISTDDFIRLSDQVSDTDTFSYSEIILALPHDSLATERKSIHKLVDIGINNITQHQLALIHGTELSSRESRKKYQMRSGFRPVQRSVGLYYWKNQKIPIADIEEICIGTNTLSFEDYLETRRLYLTTGLFYNDRVLGEINALLRILKIPTSEWFEQVHQEIGAVPELAEMYNEFTEDTKKELWNTPEQLTKDVHVVIKDYASGKLGGNVIYKYRSKALFIICSIIQTTAFRVLRKLLAERELGVDNVVTEIERFAKLQKDNLLDLNIDLTETFSLDILKMIRDVTWVRSGGTLTEISYPTTLRFRHSEKQKQMIKRQLDFYGNSPGGLTMLIARFPVKRFYRTVEKTN